MAESSRNQNLIENIRTSVGSFIYGRNKLQTERESVSNAIRSAIEAQREVWTPGSEVFQEAFLEALREVDASAIYDIMASLDPTYGIGYGVGLETERMTTVSRSRQAWRLDPVTQWIVWVWTNFAYGENIEMTVVESTRDADDREDEDEPDPVAVQEASNIITEFWTADRNSYVLGQDNLQALSETLLVDGEEFLILYSSELDGETTIRYALTDEIMDIITEPGDKTVPLYYRRQYESGGRIQDLYYMDWLTAITTNGKGRPDVLPRDAIRAEEVRDGTFVCMIHVKMNMKSGRRGWPLMTAGLPWAREHKKFREYRTAVAAGVASIINKVKVKGGSRAIDQARAKLNSALATSGLIDTNPPQAAASTFLENDAAELSRMPLTTGASDAKTDGESLLLMAALGGGLFPHWVGAGDAYRLATASAMESPLLREFSRYQNYWATVFRHVARVVIWASIQWGGPGRELEKDYELIKVDVSTDRLVEVDLPAISESVSKLFQQTIVPLLNVGSIDTDVVYDIMSQIWVNALQAIGAQDAGKIASADRFMPKTDNRDEPPTGDGSGDDEPPQDGNPDDEPPDDFPELNFGEYDPTSILGRIQTGMADFSQNFTDALTRPRDDNGGDGTIEGIDRVRGMFESQDDAADDHQN